MSEIRVLIIEDDPLIANDIKGCLLEKDYVIFGIAHSLQMALEQLENHKPDIALVDLNLGNNMDGFKIAEKLYTEFDIPFIYLTAYSSKQVLEQAKQTHPMGYIVKPFDEDDLYTSIEVALFNYAKIHRPKKFTRQAINDKLATNLTSREFEILQDIYEGNTNQQLCEKHFISMNTIKTHVHRIYNKLGCHTRLEAIAMIRSFLID